MPSYADDTLAAACDPAHLPAPLAELARDLPITDTIDPKVSPADEMQGCHARWHPDATERGTVHVIELHADYAEAGSVSGTVMDDATRRAFGLTCLRHECAHARYTTRDTNELGEAVRLHRIPPVMFQLFEDARIEARDRDRTGLPMEWQRFNRFGADHTITHPLHFFRAVSFHDGDDPRDHGYTWDGAATTTWRGQTFDTGDLILAFHAATEARTTTRALWPVMKEFQEVFGGYAITPADIRKFLQDLKNMLDKLPNGQPAPDPDAKPEQGDGEADGTGKGEPDDADGKEGDEHGTGAGKDIATTHAKPKPTRYGELPPDRKPLTPQEHADLSVFQPCGDKGNATRAKRIAKQARQLARELGIMFAKRDHEKQTTATTGTRLHFGNAITGDGQSFRRANQRDGKRKLFVLMDMSGSMDENFDRDGVVFLAALNQLDRDGVLDTQLVLTGSYSRCVVPKNATDIDLAKLDACGGGEGIDGSLHHYQTDIMAADTVLIYTDGYLSDGRIRAAEWSAKGVDLVGCAVMNRADEGARIRNALLRHFHRGIVETSGHRLASRIVQYVLSRG